ncbi:MAG: T9SS type A sorting domain-containing protein, partial [Flavobacteriales bacterium]|nr:T9SS type A sorting domain-containing protein [Flavobacteriales bacterium]
MMIAGQDIGWDQSGDANAYGTAATQAFYQNYMHAAFVADGSTTNSSADFVDDDAVFGGVNTSSINAVYGATYVYPDEITPLAPATAILNYNGNASKIGGLRVQANNYKVVYFGVAPEQMSNASVGDLMVSLSHDWFYGLVSEEEFDAALQGALYPVPASTELFLSLPAAVRGATVEIFDALGRIVDEQHPTGSKIRFEVADLAPGTYGLRITDANGHSSTRPFSIAR